MLARRAAAEITAYDQYLGALRLGAIQDELAFGRAVRVIAPISEQLPAESLLGGGGQEARRNDLIGVDVARGDDHGLRMYTPQRLHHSISRGSATVPLTALAAAVSGLASRVRAPMPCRPSKFRLLVL